MLFWSFIFQVQLGVLCKDLVYQFDASLLNKDYWVTYNDGGFVLCNSLYILYFQSTTQSVATRNINLPPHYKVYLELNFYRIQFSNLDLFQLFIDNELMLSETFSSSTGSNTCEDMQQISLQAGHTSNIVAINMLAKNSNTLIDAKWGLSHFALSIEPCPIGCQYCEQNSELQCKEWALQYWDQSHGTHYLSDVTLYWLRNCNPECYYPISLPQHTQVMIRFRLFVEENMTISILIDNLIHLFYTLIRIPEFQTISEFTSYPILHTRKSITIKITKTTGNIWFYIRDFQVLAFKGDDNTLPIIPGCSNFIMGECSECESGWEFDSLSIQCLPICGDKLLVGFQQCDDGNDIKNDGCHECLFQCVHNCISCLFGICSLCSEGNYLDNYNNCLPICGDGILQPYLEQCDENNTNYPDVCFNCRIKCYDHCNRCSSLFCLECETGFFSKQDQCYPVCGDTIVIDEYEQCDDGNNEPYDGCFDCAYQCRENCNLCDRGICLDICPYGQVMVNHICQSICGNNIITEDEECDDGNLIQYDGCYQCLYSCPLFCSYCEIGICFECLTNYKLSNNTCSTIQICGDGEIQDQEECDDGNEFVNDGCFNCYVELNWICNLANPSKCVFELAPTMIVRYLNQTLSIQYVELTFSQEIAIFSDIPLSLSIQLTVLNVSDKLYNITIFSILEAKNDFSFARYCISIEIKQLMEEKPILQIDLNQEVVNSHGISITNPIDSIDLKIPQYLTSTQKQVTLVIQQFNQNIIIVLGVISLISLLMGETSIFQEILNILQYIAYLKFINLNIPKNLFLFFQIFDLVSITPLLEYMGLDKWINRVILKEDILASHGKFETYQINADLMANLFCQFLQYLIFVIFIIGRTIFQRLLLQDNLRSKYFYSLTSFASSESYITVFPLKSKLYHRIRTFFITYQVLVLVGLRALLLVNSWDLLFKTFLFLSSAQLNNIKNYISATFSILIIIAYFKILIFCLGQENVFGWKGRQKLKKKQFETLNLGRQILFLMSLVFNQRGQVTQTLFINAINLGYLVILQVNKKIKVYTNFIQLLTEGSILLYTMSSVVYFEDFKSYISEKNKIIFGFAHISILSFSIIVLVIKYFVIKGKALLSYILSQFNKKEKNVTPIHPFLT